MIVQNEGKQVVFDWSHQSASAIQWAAFYSDCGHEIETVTEGERITLTYNLYVTEPVGGSIPPSLILDPRSLSLHSFLRELVMEPGFMKNGVFAISSHLSFEQRITKLTLPRRCFRVLLFSRLPSYIR